MNEVSHAGRELLVARIISGRTRVAHKGRGFTILEPTAKWRAAAAERERHAFGKAVKRGLPTVDEAVEILRSRKLWTAADDSRSEEVGRDIEKLKIDVYEKSIGASAQAVEVSRRNLRAAEKVNAELTNRKFRLYEQTADAHAGSIKLRYLIGRGLRRGGKPLWTHEAFWLDQEPLLDEIIAAYLKVRPNEACLRDLARNDPWRTIWSCREACGAVFNRPAGDLGEAQKGLLVWTRLYDSAREDQEPPPEGVVKDDDAFDGWLLSKRGSKTPVRKVSKWDKIENSSSIFTPSQGSASATIHAPTIAEINALNDPLAARKKEQLFRKLDKTGGGEGTYEKQTVPR